MKKRVAVIGFGGQGAWHCSFYENSDVVELAGIYDIKAERLELAKEKGFYVYGSNDEIFNDKSVDIILVATPNDIHEELSIKALETGHHVICEKPVALSVESFDRIINTAKKNNKVFSVHQNRRWDSEYLSMKDIIDSRELGEVFRIENRVQGSHGIPGDWRKEKSHGGGMIYDWGVHLIDQVLTLFPQKITEINSYATALLNTEVDDGFRMEILFETGLSAYIEVSTYNFKTLPRFYLQCEKGTAVISNWHSDVEISKLLSWEEENIKPIQTSAGITRTMAPRSKFTCKEYIKPLPKADVHDFYRNFCNVIDGIEEQIIKNSQVRRVLQVIEIAFESAETNNRIKVSI